MLDVRRLRALREVALHGTIRAAAEALSFTPSAVSQQVSALERDLGVELLERNGRSVHLTGAGRALVERTEGILAELAETEAVVKTIAGGTPPAFRVASFASAAATIVADAVRGNGLDVHILEADPRLGLARLRAGEVDVAILWEYDFVPLKPPGAIELRPLLDDPIHVVLPRMHPAAASPTIDLIDLADEPWINSTPLSSCHPPSRPPSPGRLWSGAGSDPAAVTARPASVTRRPADPPEPAQTPNPCGLPARRQAGSGGRAAPGAPHRGHQGPTSRPGARPLGPVK